MPIRKHPVALSASARTLERLPLDWRLVDRLKRTYALMREGPAPDSNRLASLFYAKLFQAAPSLRALFRDDEATQAKKLTLALDAVVRNLEHPEENATMLAALGERHATYGARPEHYDLVITLLVESMGEVLPPTADASVLEEWRIALRLVSDQMIAAAARKASETIGHHP